MNRSYSWLLALGLVVGPLSAAASADTASYDFGLNSEVDYLLVHPMHHVKGVTHSLVGKVTLADGKLVTPLKLTVGLLKFNSGNANRDANALFTLGVDRYPTAVLDVSSFKETSRSTDKAGLHIGGTAEGRMNLHGMSHAVSVPLTAVVSGNTLTVDGEFDVLLTDYGIARPALLGVPVHDDVHIVVHAVGTKAAQ